MQHTADVEADLRGLAVELSSAEGDAAWKLLHTKEKAAIKKAFQTHHLDFNALVSQVHQLNSSVNFRC
jgi:hypothetical protein